jgi:CBS domain-containing protein
VAIEINRFSSPETTVLEAMSLMSRHHIPHFPVPASDGMDATQSFAQVLTDFPAAHAFKRFLVPLTRSVRDGEVALRAG